MQQELGAWHEAPKRAISFYLGGMILDTSLFSVSLATRVVLRLALGNSMMYETVTSLKVLLLTENSVTDFYGRTSTLVLINFDTNDCRGEAWRLPDRLNEDNVVR